MQRSLRMNRQTSHSSALPQESPDRIDRSLRIDEDVKIGESIDRLYELTVSLQAKNDAHKRETKALESQIKDLTAEVRSYAEEHSKTRISGTTALVEFSPSISRSVNPIKLLSFLKNLGKTSEFWKFAKVNIGDVTKYYGEAVLESAEVLKIEVAEHGNCKVMQNST